MNNDVATVAKELGELKELLNEFSTDFKEVKALLHGIRLDLNQLAKTNNLSLASHELEARRKRQRLADLEAARLSIYLAIIGPIVGLTQRGEGGIFTRGRILGFIEAHPGIHFSALRDALSLGNGVTAHHIQILEKEGRIISWIDGKLRRFASSGVDQNRLEEIQNPVVGMQVAILQILADSDNLGIKSGELRAKLETSRQLLSYHMKQLTQRKLVESSGKGRALRWSLLEAGKKQLETSHHLNNPISD